MSHRKWSTFPVVASGAASLALLAACSTGSTPDSGTSSTAGSGTDEFEVVLVSKAEGISWFERMREGVAQCDADFGDVLNARQTGPDTGDPAKQVQVIEDLIAQGVDAIVVVPNDPMALEPVLKKARDRGIVVVAHEGPALAETEAIDYDLESFDNVAFGEGYAEGLAEAMGGKGTWVAMVGSLTMETHMAWYQAMVDYFAENYPEITLAASQPYESNIDDAQARANAEEIINAYPDLTGYFGASIPDGNNFAQVLKEKNNTQIKAVALSMPSEGAQFLDDGWLAYAQTWDPAGAGYAGCNLALKVLQGESIETGLDLGIEGYTDMVIDGKIATGEATLPMRAGDFSDGDLPF